MDFEASLRVSDEEFDTWVDQASYAEIIEYEKQSEAYARRERAVNNWQQVRHLFMNATDTDELLSAISTMIREENGAEIVEALNLKEAIMACIEIDEEGYLIHTQKVLAVLNPIAEALYRKKHSTLATRVETVRDTSVE